MLAAEHLRSFVKAKPRDEKAASARLLLGVSLTHLKKYTEARSELTRFVSDFPKDPNRGEALFRIGECSYLLGEYATAVRGLDSYLKSAPKHTLRDWGHYYLGDALVQQKQFTAAEAIYRKSLAEFPRSTLANDVRYGLAVCCQHGMKQDEARRLFGRLAADKASGHADRALAQLGSLEFDAKRFADAASAWDRLARDFPKSPEASGAKMNSGFARFQLQQYTEAIASFRAARTNKAQAAEADYWRGVSYKALDKTDEAIRAFRDAESNQPAVALARDIQFQWADTEFRSGQYDLAASRFQDVITRWPRHPAADQALLFATESVLLSASQLSEPTNRQKKLAEAGQLVDRFAREFPKSRLTARHRLQAGRLKLAAGKEADLRAAVGLFRQAVSEGDTEQSRNRARYQLARAASRLGDNKLVLQTLRPFLKSIDDSNKPGEFDDALVLAASSFLAAGQHKSASTAATRYLKKHPTDQLATDALAVQAESAEALGESRSADLSLTRLANVSRNNPVYAQTVRRMAEQSYKAKDYARSSTLFGHLVALGPRSPFHAAGLSGRGWSLFESRKYAEAAEIFGRVVSLHPKDDLAAEAAYKSAESYEKAGQATKAAEAFRLASQSYAQSSFAFLAARRAARLLALGKKTAEADSAYAALLKDFPKAKDQDALLYEWAGVHADADDFKKADVLYRRLIREHPRSKLVSAAQFSLAESDLLAGQLAKAQATFQQVARSSTAPAEIRQDALFRLVGIAAENKDWKQVRQLGQSLLTGFPESQHTWEVRFQLGQAALHLADLPTATRELSAVVAQGDASGVGDTAWFEQVYVLLAEAQFRAKAYDAVTGTVRDFEEQRPQSKVLYKAHEILGRSLAKKPRPDFVGARQAFQRVIDSPDGRKTLTAARSHLQLADSFLLQKNYREAKKQFLAVQILYRYPEVQAPALFQAASCQVQLKEFRGAVETFELLVKEFPQSSFATKAKKRLPQLRRLIRS